MHDSELVVVHSFGSQSEADLAHSALEAAGIDAIVRADRLGGLRRHIAWAGDGVAIMVVSVDGERARAARALACAPRLSEADRRGPVGADDRAAAGRGPARAPRSRAWGSAPVARRDVRSRLLCQRAPPLRRSRPVFRRGAPDSQAGGRA